MPPQTRSTKDNTPFTFTAAHHVALLLMCSHFTQHRPFNAATLTNTKPPLLDDLLKPTETIPFKKKEKKKEKKKQGDS